jgi:hypothetical protein
VAPRLQLAVVERLLVDAVARGALSVAVLAVVASTLLTSPVVTCSQCEPRGTALGSGATDVPSERGTQQDAARGSVDLYGNEVTDAIATYSLDPAGGLYELHSPQTELPRLGSPKS